MSRIKSDRKIRAAAFFVGGITRRVQTMGKMRAYRGDQMAASRKAKHSDLVRIDVPFGGVKADKANGPLGVLQRHG